MAAIEPRSLTAPERAMLDALLALDIEDADDLRRQSADVRVVSVCGCGCPSIDFVPPSPAPITVRATGHHLDGDDSLSLHTVTGGDGRPVLGGIEWVGNGLHPEVSEFPHPSRMAFDAGWVAEGDPGREDE